MRSRNISRSNFAQGNISSDEAPFGIEAIWPKDSQCTIVYHVFMFFFAATPGDANKRALQGNSIENEMEELL